MKAGFHCMPAARPEASATLHLVQIEVSPTHPLLVLRGRFKIIESIVAITYEWC